MTETIPAVAFFSTIPCEPAGHYDQLSGQVNSTCENQCCQPRSDAERQLRVTARAPVYGKTDTELSDHPALNLPIAPDKTCGAPVTGCGMDTEHIDARHGVAPTGEYSSNARS
jgi:hypothetical protein